MAFTYGFYNSYKGDRKYNAEQVSEIFDGILKDGIIPSIGQKFAVTTANNGMQINIGTGRAWFHHTWSKNDSVMVLTVPYSDISRNRYDAVVLEVNRNDDIRANSIKIVKGVPDVNATKPTLINTDKVHQYPLAYILVKAGAERIEAKDIENMVGRTPTVFATGVLETTPLDDLWSQWEGEWDDWFSDIKLQLSGNVATNLQLQIDQLRTSIPAKASNSEMISGTNSSKYATPAGVKAAIDSHKDEIKDQSGSTFHMESTGIIPKICAIPANMGYSKDGSESGLVRLRDYIVRYFANQTTVRFTILSRNSNKYKWCANYVVNHNVSVSSTFPTVDSLAIPGGNYFFLAIQNQFFRCYASATYVSMSSLGGASESSAKYYGRFHYINSTYSIYYIKPTSATVLIYKLNNSSNVVPTSVTWNLQNSDEDRHSLIGYKNGVMDAYLVYVYNTGYDLHIERFDVSTNSSSTLSFKLSLGFNNGVMPNVYYDSIREINIIYKDRIFYKIAASGNVTTVQYSESEASGGTPSSINYAHGVFEYFSSGRDISRVSYVSKQVSNISINANAAVINSFGQGYIFEIRRDEYDNTGKTRARFFVSYDGTNVAYLEEGEVPVPGTSADVISMSGFSDDQLIVAGPIASSVYDIGALTLYGKKG